MVWKWHWTTFDRSARDHAFQTKSVVYWDHYKFMAEPTCRSNSKIDKNYRIYDWKRTTLHTNWSAPNIIQTDSFIALIKREWCWFDHEYCHWHPTDLNIVGTSVSSKKQSAAQYDRDSSRVLLGVFLGFWTIKQSLWCGGDVWHEGSFCADIIASIRSNTPSLLCVDCNLIWSIFDFLKWDHNGSEQTCWFLDFNRFNEWQRL